VKTIALKKARGKFVIEVPVILRIPVLMDLVRERSRWLSGINLTKREKEVLDGIVRGLQHKEIAGMLNISARTSKFHASNLFEKFGVRDRHELRNLFSEGDKR